MAHVEQRVCENIAAGPGVALARAGHAYPWDELLVRRMLAALHEPPVQVVLWDGTTYGGAATATPLARVHFRDRRALLATLIDPDLHFGDAFSQGRIEVEGDLVAFLEEMFRRGAAGVARGRRQGNTLRESRHNIQHHYDIGNEFYRLWLDERMVYTCAYFARPEMTLEQAQVAKLDHVCRKLRLRPGERVVEAGCGWGALALRMAERFGVVVRAFNLSHEQVAFAREAARRAGLAGRVEFIEDDYRAIAGQYDAFVSVGMLEHVGQAHYRELGGVIDRCLTPGGRGLIHSIGRHRPIRLSRWITTRIFPGAQMPTLQEMMDIFEPHDFVVLDVENLRLHYAQTLRCWLERFERSAGRVREMFDERFVRAWRLYLAGSVAAFDVGLMQLFQVLFTRNTNNDVPWTRAGLYRDAP